MGGSTITQSETRIEALRLQSSAYGAVIPMLWGVCQISGNLLDYRNFTAIAHTTSQGGKGGSDFQSTNYTYTADVIMALGRGVVTDIPRIWRGKKVYQAPGTSGTALGDLGMTLKGGAIAQATWTGLTGGGVHEIGYSGMAYVAAQAYDLGSSASVENHKFEVVANRAYSVSVGIVALPDVPVADVLADLLDDTTSGAAFPTAYRGSWTEWRTWCIAGNLLASVSLTTQQRAADCVDLATRLTNTGAVWSGGKLKMVPYADQAVTGNGVTYTPATTPVYDLDDEAFVVAADEPPVRVDGKSPADRMNEVRVEYSNRDNQYNPEPALAFDKTDIEANGKRTMPSVGAKDWIASTAVARQVAQLIMQRSLYVDRTYSFRLPWNYALLEPMDLVTLTDTRLQLARRGVRITAIEENDEGDLHFTAEPFLGGVATSPLYGAQAGSGFGHDYNAAPGNVDTPVIFEAPADRTTTGIEVYAAVRGSSANWGGCQVWLSLDGSEYRQVGTVVGPARYGTVTLGASGSAAVAGLSGDPLLSASADDVLTAQTLCWIKGASGPGEYIAYLNATLTGAGAFTLAGLARGLYGTTAAARTGAAFVRVDPDRLAKSGSLEPSYVGRTVYFKFCSFNRFGLSTQSLAAAAAYTYVITGGMAALSVPPGSRVFRQGTDPALTQFVPNGADWQDTSTGRQYARVAGAWQPIVGDLSIDTLQMQLHAATDTLSASLSADDVYNFTTTGSTPINRQILPATYTNTTARAVNVEISATIFALLGGTIVFNLSAIAEVRIAVNGTRITNLDGNQVRADLSFIGSISQRMDSSFVWVQTLAPGDVLSVTWSITMVSSVIETGTFTTYKGSGIRLAAIKA